MKRLRDYTIRARLRALVLISTVGLAAVLGLSALVLHWYRVEGPVHLEVQMVRHLLTAVEPSVLTIERPHLIARGVPFKADPVDIRRDLDELAALEQDYRDSYEFWKDSTLDPSVKKTFLVDCHRPAEEFFRLVREELAPLVRANEMDKAKTVLQERIEPKFAEYRRRFTPAVQLARNTVTAVSDDASQAASRWMWVMLGISVASVAAVGLLGWVTVHSITRSTHVLIQRVREMAGGAGDLTARIQVDSRDEMAELAEGINAMIGKIHAVVRRVREGSVQLLSTASEIAATARQQEGTVHGLSSATTEIAAAVREISATSKELAGTMEEVSQSADQAAGLAAAGRDGLGRMEATMKQLFESTASISAKLGIIREKAENINAVVTTIAKVADQTNLLSINAAIEAEKAGEYGRGFLVVAREIRRLADQTAVATLDIESMVRLMQDAVSAGVMQMDKFSGEFRSGTDRVAEINGQTGQIIAAVENLTDRFQSVNEGMQSQTVAARQINEAMVPVAGGTQETQVSLEEFIKATAFLRQSVEVLNQEVAQFTV